MKYKPCICCGKFKKHTPLCFHCKLPNIVSKDNRCLMCFTQSDTSLCTNCHSSPLPWNELRYLFRYDSIHYILHRMKFDPSMRIGKFLSELMASQFADLFTVNNFDLVIPAPITEKSLYKRKFNQSYILAKCISSQFKLPLQIAFNKSGETQSSLSEIKRKGINKNLSLRLASGINSKRILLVDDIITTGSTAAACALELRKIGARSISVYTLSSATANEIFPFYLRSSFLKPNEVQVRV